MQALITLVAMIVAAMILVLCCSVWSNEKRINRLESRIDDLEAATKADC